MPVTASAEASHRSAATARFGVSAAYLLNEADIAPCGRDSASLRPFLSAGTEKALSLPKLGVHLISRAVRRLKINAIPICVETLTYKADMKTSNTHNQRIAKMTFASVYPMYLEKVQKKGRTKAELHQVIEWLTGFDNKKLQGLIKEKATFETFFQQASLNPNAHLITGVICGYRVEDIEDPLTQQARYLDKLVDELAKGRKMEKILRSA
jgi:hypothetical protein